MSLFDAILSLFNPEVDAEFDTLWKNYFKGLASWCQEARIDLSRNLSYGEKKRIYEHKEAIRSRHNTIVTEEKFNAQVMCNKLRSRYYADYLLSYGRSANDKEYVLSYLEGLDSYISRRIEEEYNRLKGKYPRGIDGYESSCNPKPSKEAVIALGEAKLSELEQRGIEVERGEQWIKGQNEYAQFCRDLRDKMFPQWGCYYYDIPAQIPTFNGSPKTVNYGFWQIFYRSYCDVHDLDYSVCPALQENYESLPNLRYLEVHFPKSAYDSIMQGILSIKEQYGDCVVIFGNSYDPNEHSYDEQEMNNFHFKYLKEQLKQNAVECVPLPIMVNVPDCEGYAVPMSKHVIVVELISTNKEMKRWSETIISSLNCNQSHICYISLMKGCDKDEAEKFILHRKQLIKKREQEKEQKEKDLQYLKSCVANWERPRYSSIKCFSMYYYYPTTCDWEADGDVWEIRNLIWNFKANPPKSRPMDEIISLHQEAVERIVAEMSACLQMFFGDKVSKLTLACIPASSQEITQRRYEDFSNELCKLTGMTNGYSYIRVKEDGDAKHTGGTKKPRYDIDKEFFKGKFVLLFDDVITRGESMGLFGIALKGYGAEVIGGFSIGITKHELQSSFDPIVELFSNPNHEENN